MVTESEYLLQALKDAEQMELDGRQFYLEAASKVKSVAVRQALEFLAESEKYHIDKFNQIYLSLQNDPLWTESIAVFEPRPCNPNVFAKAIKTIHSHEPGDYHYDLQALESCLLMEQTAVDCYTRLAKESRDPLSKRFFMSLAAEEQEHYNLIFNLKKFVTDNLPEYPQESPLLGEEEF
jgi:rubrerythrin